MEIERVGRERGPGGPWRMIAVVASPVVAVVLVVAAALAGGSTVPPPRPSPLPVAEASAGPTPEVALARPARLTAPDPGYPEEILGLRTRSVAVVRGALGDGSIGRELVAVRAYMTIRPGLEGCLEDVAAPAQLRSVSCVRETLLLDDRDPTLGWADAETVVRVGPRGRAHLHGTVFPGVSMAAAEAYVSTDPPPMGGGSALGEGYFLVPSVPVVAIGRFGDPRLARAPSGRRHPDEAFTIERIAWVAGAVQRTPVVRLVHEDAASETAEAEALATLRRAATDALPAAAQVLGLTVLDGPTLASVDEAVAEAIGVASASGPLWYARAALVTTGPPGWMADDPARLAWAIVDGEGALLGTGLID